MNLILPELFPLRELIEFSDERGFDIWWRPDGKLEARKKGGSPAKSLPDNVIQFRGKGA